MSKSLKKPNSNKTYNPKINNIHRITIISKNGISNLFAQTDFDVQQTPQNNFKTCPERR
jgi:hypothetical protein